MTPDDLARLHAACFTVPRPWSADEFASLLASPAVFLIPARSGFLLGREIAGEAELLTLAVAPKDRNRGQGRLLVESFLQSARSRGAETAFLEVASDNIAAQALYRRTGWIEAGRRRDYYGPGVAALVMREDLGS